MQGVINLCTLSSDSLFCPCVGHFLLGYEGEALEGRKPRQCRQNDFVILILNLIKLWYTARSHSGCWTGFFIACSFSRSLCVSCCQCINFLSQMRRVAGTLKHSQLETEPMDMPAFTHDWRVRLLAYIETKAPQYPVSRCGCDQRPNGQLTQRPQGREE